MIPIRKWVGAGALRAIVVLDLALWWPIAAWAHPPQAVEPPLTVSIVQVIASPEQFDGKRVRLLGYVHFEDEGNALYLHREDFEANLISNSLLLHLTFEDWKTFRSLSDRYVIVEGRVRAPKRGPTSYRAGVLREITRLERLRSHAETAPGRQAPDEK